MSSSATERTVSASKTGQPVGLNRMDKYVDLGKILEHNVF